MGNCQRASGLKPWTLHILVSSLWSIQFSEKGCVRISDLLLVGLGLGLRLVWGRSGLGSDSEIGRASSSQLGPGYKGPGLLTRPRVKDAGCLFDRFLNTCPSQGSRTIRTELH
eukprot:jgi/Mesen1/7430/ME000388S06645